MKKIVVSMFLFGILMSAGAQVPKYVPTDSLKGWWPFNGNANDESGNGNHGTILNGTTLSNDRKSNANSCYIIDGVNCTNARGVSFPSSISNSGDYTISLWFQSTDSTKTEQTIINTYPHEFLVVSFNYPYPSGFSNRICSFLGNGSGTWQIYGNNNSWVFRDLQDWHHLVVVKTTSVVNYYQDGKLVNSVTINSGLNSGSINQIVIGAISINGGSKCYETFKGKIDDVGLWNRALNSAEIYKLYKGCFKSIIQEPDNQAMFSGNALFTCFTDDTLLTYQWQTDLGTGWANLTNAGQYRGVNTDSLKVSNVSSGNNNQLFRCVVKGNCLTDTTRIVSLKVWGVGINDINQEVISVYPNPAGDVINFNLQANFREAVVKIYDASGKLVLSQTIHSTDAPQINVAQLSKGIYSVELSIDGKQFSSSFKKE